MTYAKALPAFTINERTIERILAFLPLIIGIVMILMLTTDIAHAQTMPWECPLSKVANSLKGPVAKAVSVIAIVVCGLMLAVGEIGGVFKTMLGLLAGVSMAILANNWLGFIDASSTFSSSC